MFLFSLSNALESRALRRTTHEIEALMRLHPEEAVLLDSDGAETQVPVDSLVEGQLVLVRPGGRVPVDANVVTGYSSVDQSAITGESIPVDKAPGDSVLAGSINAGGTLELEVVRRASESTLARIIRLVEEAREAKAPTQRFIDRFEQGYAATVIFASMMAVLVAMMFGEGFRSATYRAMTLLVVASPCAVVISTPATILAALAHAARRGLLFKGGAPLEDLASIDCVAFDKTGTLTQGAATVVEVVAAEGSTPEKVLSVAAAVEKLSEHHLARAIVEEAHRRELSPPRARGLQNSRGEGAVAEVEGHLVAVGRSSFVSSFEKLGAVGLNESVRQELDEGGLTLVHVSGVDVCGVIGIDDTA
ncbi:MAG: heavy metal translocating P-type ATPase, partial [Acidobacteriota bacterium]